MVNMYMREAHTDEGRLIGAWFGTKLEGMCG